MQRAACKGEKAEEAKIKALKGLSHEIETG
jgi:hypothetical protein